MRWERGGEVVRVVVSSVLAVGVGGLVLSFLPLYDLVARESESGGDTRYLPLAYVVAWVGVVVSVVVAGARVLARIRARHPIGWAPMVAVPLLVESWVAGFLVALVVVPM